ncbi:coniferyl aldehyde dehydrogenase [Acinetobacter ursingii]|uniref:coniferyl aldehyde dehydrogenase n=1 Tax=Acinetobacter TaxID=469 RepID=UPI0022EB9374|nr:MULTISPECIES: coniferyl aldehyde dehydrogenase [Acinetobacter]MDA3577588.1 coniferyl aldehyde dehydrogenase [Acinetobacter ursingii]MDH0809109.1 coniferyl aldehyde dehydrogenase [Acinetobacter ursingii]MDH2076561.1 coniferyl aldehyde dehydrogenase [Acinetobacter ursingii]
MQLTVQSHIEQAVIEQTLHDCFQLQRKSFHQQGIETIAQRKQHLLSLKALINDHREAIIDALNRDYGNRSRHETLLAEIITVTDDINGSIKHLKHWTKVQKRHVDHSLYFGAKNRVIPQPLGVIGIIVPWNFPINLMFSQLSAVFAAGNTAMVKMSENSRHLAELLIELSPKYFKAEKLQIFDETGEVGIAFSKLPFHHLMFTGSGATGRKVMAAAAQNLTPVTLELGGKSPAVIDPEYPIEKAVERIMFVKQFNAGQICTNVDYLFVHESKLQAFIQAAAAWVQEHVPDIHSKDYTSVIDERAFQRLVHSLADAEAKGASLINLNQQEPDAATRKFPLTLVLNSNDEMEIDTHETFGPILMVKTYQKPEDVVDYIVQRDRPLAFYPFSNNKSLVEFYISRVMSGGVSVNDALFHVGQHDLPFGGVGASGMGHYHGYEGFLTFSKMRPVFYQAGFSSLKFLAPPYGKFANWLLNLLIRIKS